MIFRLRRPKKLALTPSAANRGALILAISGAIGVFLLHGGAHADVCTTPPPGDLVVNGGFEQPVATNGYQAYLSGQMFCGWTVVSGGSTANGGSEALVDKGFGSSIPLTGSQAYQAHGGNQSFTFSNLQSKNPTPGEIQQTIATTAGSTYELTFYLYARDVNTLGPGVIQVSAGTASKVVSNADPNGSYLKETLDFTAAPNTTSTTITFTEAGNTTQGPGGSIKAGEPSIDDVAVVATNGNGGGNKTPEAPSAVLFGVGTVAALAVARKFRRRASGASVQ